MESEAPEIIPCLNGEEILLDKDLAGACLSAISIKEVPEIDDKTLKPNVNNLFTHRNSFINLHRPEMTKVPAAPKSPHKLKQYFREHASRIGITSDVNTEGLNSEQPQETAQIRWLLEARESFSSEGTFSPEETSDRIVSCSIPLTDEDLSPGEMPRKSRAQFCVLMRGFNNLSQEATDLMHEAADRLVEGSLDAKAVAHNATKIGLMGENELQKQMASTFAMSSPASLSYNGEPESDCLQETSGSITAKSCLTTRELEKGN